MEVAEAVEVVAEEAGIGGAAVVGMAAHHAPATAMARRMSRSISYIFIRDYRNIS